MTPKTVSLMSLQGESAAVENAINAVTTCLGSPKGCAVVPGLPPNQYWFTFAMSVIGGVIAGFVIKLEPQGRLPGLY